LAELAPTAPADERQPHANGGLALARSEDAGLRDYAVKVTSGSTIADRPGMGNSFRHHETEHGRKNFRLFSPTRTIQTVAGCAGSDQPLLHG